MQASLSAMEQAEPVLRHPLPVDCGARCRFSARSISIHHPREMRVRDDTWRWGARWSDGSQPSRLASPLSAGCLLLPNI